jgi:hypothetical protein
MAQLFIVHVPGLDRCLASSRSCILPIFQPIPSAHLLLSIHIAVLNVHRVLLLGLEPARPWSHVSLFVLILLTCVEEMSQVFGLHVGVSALFKACHGLALDRRGLHALQVLSLQVLCVLDSHYLTALDIVFNNIVLRQRHILVLNLLKPTNPSIGLVLQFGVNFLDLLVDLRVVSVVQLGLIALLVGHLLLLLVKLLALHL